MYRIKEKLLFVASMVASAVTAAVKGTAVAVDGAGSMAAIAVVKSVADSESVTITLHQSTLADGSDSVAIEGATFTIDGPVTEVTQCVVEAHVTRLKDGYGYVVPVVTATAETDVSVVVATDGNRFSPENEGVAV